MSCTIPHPTNYGETSKSEELWDCVGSRKELNAILHQ